MFNFKPEGSLIDTIENKNFLKNLTTLQEAAQQTITLEARAILCDADHNLIVDLGCCKGIIPRIHGAIGIEDGSTKDIAIISRVNKSVCFKIMSFQKSDNGVTAILSRKLAQEECMNDYIKKLSPGDIIDAKVTHLEQFGCFVDIGCGIPSMIPIDAISISRISHPKDRFRQGQSIKVIVKNVDENSRITLSHKELIGTWEENANLFEAGQTVAGIVRTVEDYGVFIELTPNLAGLAEPRDDIKPGQQASVYIKSLIQEKMKVKLIIVDSFDAKYTVSEPKYFLDKGHINYWKYSPDICDKVIESYF